MRDGLIERDEERECERGDVPRVGAVCPKDVKGERRKLMREGTSRRVGVSAWRNRRNVSALRRHRASSSAFGSAL